MAKIKPAVFTAELLKRVKNMVIHHKAVKLKSFAPNHMHRAFLHHGVDDSLDWKGIEGMVEGLKTAAKQQGPGMTADQQTAVLAWDEFRKTRRPPLTIPVRKQRRVASTASRTGGSETCQTKAGQAVFTATGSYEIFSPRGRGEDKSTDAAESPSTHQRTFEKG